MTGPAAATPAADDGVRLAKRVAEIQGCSRREAELLIEGGWVRVDGHLIEEPQFRVRGQAVAIDPRATPTAPPPVTILLNKLPGFDAGTGEPVNIPGLGKGLRPPLELVSASSRSADDRSSVTLLKKHLLRQALCTPLETAASGLVVFTQDARVGRRLAEDAASIEQEFMVEVQGEVGPEALQRLNTGSGDGSDRALPPVKASVSSTGPSMTRLRFAVKGSHPGLIAHLCERAGLRIAAMKRIRVGRVPMGALEPGQWRLLLPHERF